MKNSNRILLFTCFITFHGFPVAFRIRNTFFFFLRLERSTWSGYFQPHLIVITLSQYNQTTVVLKDSPNYSGVVHVISDFWNVPALLLICWLFSIFRSQLEGSHRSVGLPLKEGRHLSSCPFYHRLPFAS